MSLLNFEPSKPNRSSAKKRPKLVLGIGAIVATIAIGSTLAASINLNSGAPVEFGQGVTQTTSCDDEITLTPYSTFVNAQGGGTFMGTSIVISGVDSSAGGCGGKSFTITGYGDTSPIAQIIVSVESTSPWFTIEPIAGASLTDVSSSSFTITIDPNIEPIEASDVSRFTIESKDSILGEPDPGPDQASYEVGETGPGGGWIVYKNLAGFSCGPTQSATCFYLESAKSDWNSGTNEFPWASSPYDQAFVGGSTSNRSASSCDSIGCGYMNSKAAVDEGSDITSAVGISRAYNGGGKSDWYLPSLGEFAEMARTLYEVDLVQSIYWTSSEKASSPVRGMWSTAAAGASGFSNYNVKSARHTVRPIRAF
jgi:hypothetical protein